MIIGVDAGALSVTDQRLKVGVYRVTKNAVLTLAGLDKENNYRFYTFGAIEEGILRAFGKRAKLVRLPALGWQRLWLPLELKRHPVDAFLGFAQSLPSVRTLCDIGFVYDLGFMYEPQAYGAHADALRKQTDRLAARAHHIMTISRSTRTDILSAYALPEEQITVAYPGVDRSFSPFGERYRWGRPYFLFVGSLNKAKDIPLLLSLFAGFCRQNRTTDLLLVGGDFWPDPVIDDTIKRLGLGDRVKKAGVVPDSDLPAYYRGAVAFVSTALREGFCLPAAEAMACGTPVIAYNRGALGEVVGEGGVIVTNPRTFRDALVGMGDLKKRASLSKKAVVQAKQYQWGTFAKHILTCIDSVFRYPGLDPGSSLKIRTGSPPSRG